MLPVRLFSTPEVSHVAVEAAGEALNEVVSELGRVAVLDYYGDWKSPKWKDRNGDLQPHQSVEWYFRKAWVPERNQLDILVPINLLDYEPGKYGNDPHYDVVLVGRDLWNGQPDNRFCVGAALGRSTIVSTARFDGYDNFPELVKQETAHEFGHLLGMGDRSFRSERSLGLHCINQACTMRQGLRVPLNWQQMASERLQNGNRYFCDDCHRDAVEHGTI